MDQPNNLPAAVASPPPCESPETIIWWWNPSLCEEDHEVFESLDAALAELEKWKIRFPWNTYHVATEVLTHVATEEWADPAAALYSQLQGAAAGSHQPCAPCCDLPSIEYADDLSQIFTCPACFSSWRIKATGDDDHPWEWDTTTGVSPQAEKADK